jgi:hypothetical protein
MGLDHFLWFYASARDLVFLGIFVSLLDPLGIMAQLREAKIRGVAITVQDADSGVPSVAPNHFQRILCLPVTIHAIFR